MKFHNITCPDMLNGDGLRVVLWLSGCEMHCKNCQNPETWDPEIGVVFDNSAKQELFSYLSKDYISGITFSGGHPLHEVNVKEVYDLILEIREKFPNKTIWLYTGYYFEDLIYNGLYENSNNLINKIRLDIISNCDIVIDGPYIEELKDTKLHWRGSSNQRIVDIQKTMKKFENKKDQRIPLDIITKMIETYDFSSNSKYF